LMQSRRPPRGSEAVRGRHLRRREFHGDPQSRVAPRREIEPKRRWLTGTRRKPASHRCHRVAP
jgi:hypothetical protein